MRVQSRHRPRTRSEHSLPKQHTEEENNLLKGSLFVGLAVVSFSWPLWTWLFNLQKCSTDGAAGPCLYNGVTLVEIISIASWAIGFLAIGFAVPKLHLNSLVNRVMATSLIVGVAIGALLGALIDGTGSV